MIRRLLHWLREPFGLLLMTPALIAAAIGLLPFPLVWIETHSGSPGPLALGFTAETARAVLSIIATAAMTTLSLAYSLTLVVFTLAASSIGPRLLKRFTSDRVSQITAGVFAGAFLYALIAIAFVAQDRPTGLSVIVALLLAALMVLQLIVFVRHVARSVSIDDEVAAIAQRLTTALGAHRERYRDLDDLPDDESFATEVKSRRTGYIGWIDEDELTALAAKYDIVLRIEERPGLYVLEGSPLARISGGLDEAAEDAIADCISIDASRSSQREVEFSIHLLVEIGLRALSPGVNDQYTAIAVSDAISGAIADILGQEQSPSGLLDGDGKPRLIVPGLSVKQLIGQAYHPLRRAATESILMSQALARAYASLYQAATDDAERAIVVGHARLLIEGLRQGHHMPEDQDSVAEILPSGLREALRDDEAKAD